MWRLAGLPRVVLIDVVSRRGVSCVCRRSYVSRRRSSGAEVITILTHVLLHATFMLQQHMCAQHSNRQIVVTTVLRADSTAACTVNALSTPLSAPAM